MKNARGVQARLDAQLARWRHIAGIRSVDSKGHIANKWHCNRRRGQLLKCATHPRETEHHKHVTNCGGGIRMTSIQQRQKSAAIQHTRRNHSQYKRREIGTRTMSIQRRRSVPSTRRKQKQDIQRVTKSGTQSTSIERRNSAVHSREGR